MSVEDLRETMRFLQARIVELQEENRALQQDIQGWQDIFRTLLTLQEMANVVTEQTNVLNLLDRILESALRSIGAADGSLMLIDADKAEMVFVVVHGAIREKLVNHRISLGHGIAGWAATHGEAVRVSDVSLDERFSPDIDHAFDFHTRSMLCVPVIYAGRVLGVIQALNKQDGEQFVETELTLLGIVANLAALAIYKAETAVAA